AIVTGAGRGLGKAMTLGLLDAGARVAAVELDAPAIEETQDAVEDRGVGERFLGLGADVTHDESGAKILRATTERFGRLDILINSLARRRSTGRKIMGNDAGRVSPGRRCQPRCRLPDDAGRTAYAAGETLGSHHQRHDQSRHDVAKPHATVWRLQGR